MPYHILVADDSESIRDHIQFILGSEDDFTFEFADNGHQAIQLALQSIPDLILMDLELPSISGIEAVKILKQDERSISIPIIMLTGSKSIREVFDVGASDYIRKPFDRIELIARIRNSLALKESLEEIKRKSQEIEAQKKEIEQQKEQIEKQYANLTRRKEEVTDSFLYAKRIQRALHPPDSSLQTMLPDSFVFYRPQGIIGGDFYWIREYGEKTLIAVCDCTGHGVPGAFMSVLGVALLSEIFNRCIVANRLPSASDLVDELRFLTIKSLHRTEQIDGSDDGMAISLCVLDKSKMELEFCGAQQSLCIISDNKLTQIKGDPWSVGYFYGWKDKFTNHILPVKHSDLVYAYTDGYYDQLGGPNYRKFMSKRFRHFLLSIHQKSLSDQKFALDKTISEWQGSSEQVDDMLVLGFRI